MQDENRLFEALLDVIPFAAYAVDIQTYEVVYANKLMHQSMYAPKEEFCWKKVYGQQSACSWCSIPQLSKRKKLYSNDKLIIDFFDEGSDRWYQSYDELVRWPDGRTVKYSIFVDITQQKEIQASMIQTNTKLAIQTKKLKEANTLLEELSKKDYLTKISNRANFFDQANKLFAKKLEYKSKIYAMMIDIDDFKKINDTYGHKTGDLVLREFVQALNQQLHQDDIFARIGGEEFALLTVSRDEKSVKQKIQQCQKAVCSLGLVCEDETIKVQFSIGVSQKSDNDTIDSLLDRADEMLYRAKQSGKNKAVFRV